jgi:hypothetical protein
MPRARHTSWFGNYQYKQQGMLFALISADYNAVIAKAAHNAPIYINRVMLNRYQGFQFGNWDILRPTASVLLRRTISSKKTGSM